MYVQALTGWLFLKIRQRRGHGSFWLIDEDRRGGSWIRNPVKRAVETPFHLLQLVLS